MWRRVASLSGAVILGWASIACAANLVVNGSFTQGAQDATSWDHPTADRGTVRGGRDTSVFASAPASLKIEAASGAALGKSAQTITNVTPGTYRVAGKMKVTNAKAAGLAMVMFGPAGRQTGWNEVVFAAGTTQWTDFEVITALPPETGTLVVMPFADLQDLGRLWIDDLSIESMAPSTDRFTLLDFSGTSLRSSYNSWTDHMSTGPEGMAIKATCDGGGSIGRWVDVTGMGNHVPILHVRTLPGNAAKTLVMTLTDENKSERTWRFTLPGSEVGMIPVLPENFASLSKPNEGNAGAWKMITDVRLKSPGDGNTALNIVVRGIELGAPGQRIGAMAPKGGSAPSTGLGAPAKATAREQIVSMADMMQNNSGYGGWVGHVSNPRGELEVVGGNNQGGVVHHGTYDLSSHKGQMPAMTIKVLPGNRATSIRFMPEDAGGKTDTYTYDLPAPSDKPVTLLPRDNKKFGDEPGFDLRSVRKYHIQGTYQDDATMSVCISKMEFYGASK